MVVVVVPHQALNMMAASPHVTMQCDDTSTTITALELHNGSAVGGTNAFAS